MTQRRTALHGRQRECSELDRLVAEVRSGASRTLVLRGEAGIGKSALLDYIADASQSLRVERAAGIESERELAFAGLHQLCQTMLRELELLPAPQSAALSIAFGLSFGAPPDPFLVGLAVLGLFSEVAEQRPLILLIDDAQWLDDISAQVLAFVARRLQAESVALIFASRPGDGAPGLTGLPELRISGLGDADARAVLNRALRWPMDAAVVDRIVADSRGNPLALLELPAGLTHAELAGGFGLPSSAPLTTVLEEEFMKRLAPLPAQTRELLLIAAIDATGATDLVRRAAAAVDVDWHAAEAAELAGLVEFEPSVRFQHPLVRSAVIRLANGREARWAHGALADSTDPRLDPDRRAWHLALAADGPNESIASELEGSAARAQERGGFAAAAAFLEAAAELTPDSGRRATRKLRAAEAKYQAGAADGALELVAQATALPLEEREVARADLLRGQLALFSRDGRDAARLLTDAAHRWEDLDARVAREAYLDAVSAGIGVGRFADDVSLQVIAAAAQGVPAEPGRPLEALLNGFATLVTDGYQKGAPLLHAAVTAFRDEPLPAADSIRWSWLATRAARELWDDENGDLLSARHVALARESGALSALPTALTTRVGMHLYRGEIAAAAMLADEIDDVAKAAGLTTPPYGALALAALQGKETTFSALASAALETAATRGDGLGFVIVQFSGAVLYNSIGEYTKALGYAEAGSAYPNDLCYSVWSLTELIEAATRTGRHPVAQAALVRLAESTRASGTEWSLGVEARSRALLSDDDSAESAYREAIERLGTTRIRMELARAYLVFGEWLRRRGRRVDARENLRTAYDLFANAGAAGYAERARRELAATGETVRKRVPDSKDELTAQEAQIATLAAEGRSNPEIGAELFISARTVEWHLGKVYPKLGISSRRELARALAVRAGDDI